METINKTFELELEGTPVKGIITSLSDDELDGIKNLGSEEYSGAAFKALILTAPELGATYFENETPKVFVVGYKGKEGQLGSIENGEFKPFYSDDMVIRKISLNILEVLMLNDNTGHFKA
ncbi:hypothetical protein [Chryseobacterium indologenes]|uniref:Uncharacterized protein n=1 Tax=Chryseobacterium indologenes TaxID=253 RepID=A0A0N0ZUL8_CHRID|nr:hypothetical protein [Chryseobacterium indologenes]KPE51256.1 hypothetical protein AOB46_11375 [Chryseobacterium indologenes]